MWQLKEPVKVISKKHRLIISRETLKADPGLADLVMNDPELRAKYGHNFKEVGTKEELETGEVVIPVDFKKKAEVTGSVSETLPESASTSTEAPNDGMRLNVSEVKPQSPSQGSQQSKQGTGNRSSQGRR